METRNLELGIPDVCPYDDNETWFETFVATHLIPLIDLGLFSRFWFTRYNAVGFKKYLAFRFETDQIDIVNGHVAKLQSLFDPQPLGYDGYTTYDYVYDLGKNENSRMLSPLAKHQDRKRRADLVFNFVHASALLFVDCLVGPNPKGYFIREPDTFSKMANETTLEQFHHLFCNMTGVPAFVCACTHPKYGDQVRSEIDYVSLQAGDPAWQGIRKFRVKF